MVIHSSIHTHTHTHTHNLSVRNHPHSPQPVQFILKRRVWRRDEHVVFGHVQLPAHVFNHLRTEMRALNHQQRGLDPVCACVCMCVCMRV